MMRERPHRFGLSLSLVRDWRSKKEVVVLLRWVLVIASCSLILFSPAFSVDNPFAHAIVLFLILSNLALASLPARVFRYRYFDHVLVTSDICLISLSIWLSGEVKSDLYLLYFLIIMIAALGETLKSILWSACLVSTVYVLVSLSIGGLEAVVQTEFMMRVPFFFVVAIFYGYFAQLIRTEQKEKAAIKKELSMARRLRELSNEIACSLDRNAVLCRLVEGQKLLCQAKYAGIISRDAKRIIAQAGEGESAPSGDVVLLICRKLGERLSRELGARKGQAAQQAVINSCESGELAAVIGNYTLIPVGGQPDADIYLCLSGSFDGETLDYSRVLLLSAEMALKNAGQYQALVHEAEKRQDVVRDLGRALEFKSHFLSNISHEIRTPIYSFIGFGELLTGDGYGELKQEQNEVISRMVDNARHLLELINNILELSKGESNSWKVRKSIGCLGDFVEDVTETCRPLLRDKPVSLRSAVSDNIPLLATDWGMLRQIVLNLVSNAVKFTEKGRVSVSAYFNAERRELCFEVLDTGIGIPESQIGEIFEPFRQLENSYTKKYAGSGLGLAITKKQVEMLGGRIEVSSQLGKGSRFCVLLPVELARTQTEQDTDREAQSNLSP